MNRSEQNESGSSRERFPAGIGELIGAYVYALRDPSTKQIFYIGKGTGDRVFAHANGALTEDGISLKNDVILEIKRRGDSVEAFIVQHGLGDAKDSEKSHAHQTESALYGLLKLIDDGLNNKNFSLSNIVAPPTFGDFGLRSIDDVIAQYGEPADASLIPHRSMFIKPTRTWKLGMSADQLYEMTHGWWPLNLSRANKIGYVFAIPKFIIRAVYEVPTGGWRYRQPNERGWDPNSTEKPRVGFDGVDVSAQFPELINKSVEHVYGKGQAKRVDCKYLDDGALKDLRKKGIEPWWNWSRIA